MKDFSHEVFARYARHYDGMAYRDRLTDDLEKLKRDRLPPWLPEIPKDARMLDLGCAQGHLLEALRRVGYSMLTGVDLSPELLTYARQRLPETVRLIEADFRLWLREVPAETYEVVFVHDVLEHLPRDHILEVLREIHRILVPEGRLSVRVPNLAASIGAFCMALDFTHITPFTEFSLIQVLESAGFEPDRIVFQSQAPRLFWCWRKPHRALFRLLNRIRWHLNNLLHRMVYLLADFVSPEVFDVNLVVVVQK